MTLFTTLSTLYSPCEEVPLNRTKIDNLENMHGEPERLVKPKAVTRKSKWTKTTENML